MRKFLNKDFNFKYKYNFKIWDCAISNNIPLLLCYDGATLFLHNLKNKKLIKSQNFHKTNAFNGSLFIKTNDYRYPNIFLLIFEQRNLIAYDDSLNSINQFNLDSKMAIIFILWFEEKNYLYLSGTNGWIKCYYLNTHHSVTEFKANWSLIFEIKTTEDWIIYLALDKKNNILYGVGGYTLYTWNSNTGEFLFRLPNLHDNFKLCQVEVVNESYAVLTSALDGKIKLWNIHYSACKLYNSIIVSPPGYLSFFLNNRSITSIGSDRIIKHFEIGDDSFKCQYKLIEKNQKISYEEVFKVNIKVLPNLNNEDLIITGYKNEIFSIILGKSKEDIFGSLYNLK